MHVIELIGESGVGKSYYSQILSEKNGYQRIKQFYYTKWDLLFLGIPALRFTLRLKPENQYFNKIFFRALYLIKYRRFLKSVKTQVVLDQGIIYKVDQLNRYCQRSYSWIKSLVLDTYKIPLPDLVVHIYSNRDLVYRRRLVRQKDMDKNLNTYKREGVTEISEVKQKLIEDLSIPFAEYFSKGDDEELFISFIDDLVYQTPL